MSITPAGPSNLGQNIKSFWSRPEGKTGMIILGGAVLGAIYAWGQIVPFIVSMLVDTVHMVELGALLAAILWVLLSERSHLMFRVIMRYLTSLFIPVFPIEIIKDHLSQMRKQRAGLEDQVTAVNGQIGVLKGEISKNAKLASSNLQYAEEAKRRAQSVSDQTERLRMEMKMRTNARAAGRKEQSNLSYQQLLTKMQRIYDLLSKWAIYIDSYIEDTDDQIKQATIQQRTINSAYRAYRTALRIIRGHGTEQEIYDETMEFLATDAEMKLGEMERFQELAQNFMDNIDLQNGVVETEALKQLDAYEQRLLTPGNTQTSFLLPGATAVPVAVQAKRAQAANVETFSTGSTAGDYGDMFK